MQLRLQDNSSDIIYEWELNVNSTRYDYALARPTETARYVRFAIVGTVNVLVTLSSLLLIVSILGTGTNKSRQQQQQQQQQRCCCDCDLKKINSFNLYLLFLMIPDFISGFSCLLTCYMSIFLTSNAEYYSEIMCGYQAWYLTYSVTTNAWMNGLIMYQVHKLLRYSNIRKRYFPPTNKQVCYQSCIIYVYAIILAFLSCFNFNNSPIKIISWYGFVCFPIESSIEYGWFFFFIYAPFLVMIPAIYSFITMFHIFYNKLLPKNVRGSKNKTHIIAFFLLRIIAVFFIIWAPWFIAAIIGYFKPVSSWINWLACVFAHLQAFFTTIVIYYTNDELRCQMNKILYCCTYCCCWFNTRDNDDDGQYDDDDDDDENDSFKEQALVSVPEAGGGGNDMVHPGFFSFLVQRFSSRTLSSTTLRINDNNDGTMSTGDSGDSGDSGGGGGGHGHGRSSHVAVSSNTISTTSRNESYDQEKIMNQSVRFVVDNDDEENNNNNNSKHNIKHEKNPKKKKKNQKKKRSRYDSDYDNDDDNDSRFFDFEDSNMNSDDVAEIVGSQLGFTLPVQEPQPQSTQLQQQQQQQQQDTQSTTSRPTTEQRSDASIISM